MPRTEFKPQPPYMTYPIKQHPVPDDLVFDKVTIELPGTRKPGQTGMYRNAYWPELLTPYNQPLHTCQDVWNSGVAIGGNGPALGYRPRISTNPLKFDNKYVWYSYNEVDERRKAVGAAVSAMFEEGKLTPTEEGGYRTVGIWSINRPEWHMIDLGNQGYNMATVALYDTLGPDAVGYVMEHASLSVVFATAEKIPSLLKLKNTLPALKVIVSIDSLGNTVRPLLTQWATDKGIELYEFDEILELGRKNPAPIIPATPDTLLTICYTSGTTGNPKGAMITHGAMASGLVSTVLGDKFDPGSTFMSYLPLAHIYGRMTETFSLGAGLSIGFFSGDNLRLLEDAQILKPRIFPSVPRVLNRVYAAASVALQAGGIKGALLGKAIEVKTRQLKTTGVREHALWDALVFKKIKMLLGGNIRTITSGSAPLSADVIDFLKIAFNGDICEGYGMTENCGCCTTNFAQDRNAAGTVGVPSAVNELKLVDVPEMGYTSLDKPYPRGELCSRGTNAFSGYFKDPVNTAKTLDSEGWLYTGDVAAIDQYGHVVIIDRVKNIMKLSQGEYVALEKVENTYSTVPVLQSTFVYGDSLRDHLVAVVVPDPVQIVEVAKRVGVIPASAVVAATDRAKLDEITKSEKVYAEVMKAMNAHAKKAGLKGFETVKAVHMTNEPFTAENVLTPTFKIKRKEAHAYFQKELDALYKIKL
ncbi:long-chain-fatty-acid-CoA ligase [Clavulina sp. PMI_390]|nr:long-chain-fatty-acid-CoA ligase [Clavulina sp. PMI_390]